MSIPAELPTTRLEPPAPSHPAGGVARSVADELEAIFPSPSEGRRPIRRRLGSGRGRATDAGARPAGKVAAWGAVIAAALVGVSAGSLMPRGRAPIPEANLPTDRPLAVAAATPAPAPVAASPPVLPSPGPLAPPVAAATAPVKAVDRAAEPVRRPATVARKAAVKRSTKPARPKTTLAACGGSRCTHSDVLAADRRLRRAYSAAIRAGVSRAVLVDYRNRWARLRHRAPREPALVVARYSAMARDLNRYASRVSFAHDDDGSWNSLRREISTGGR